MTQTELPTATSLQQDIHANHSVLLGKQKGAEDDRHIWAYLRKIIAHKKDPLGAFSRMFGHVALGLDQALLDLRPKGTPRGRLLFLPVSSQRLTTDNDASLWATPRTTDVTGRSSSTG